MMDYVSTRGGMSPSSFTDVTIAGLASDGGLTIPVEYPKLSSSELDSLRSMDYRDTALFLVGKYASDIPTKDLKMLIDKTYREEVFGSKEITPVKEIFNDVYMLDLSGGPTLAFKDIALQLLGNMFEYMLNRRDDYLNILGSTSGDTGSSAEYGIMGKNGITCIMLSPHGKMSDFQTAQMYSIDNENIHNIAINGNFDDCQDLCKAVNNDKEFKKRHHIGAVNSYNWARVAAQTVYYFKGHSSITSDINEEIDVAVPTGNFGDILAGDITKQMGLPIRKLLLATNENNVLDEFYKTGVYKVRNKDQVISTSSPSMDIAKASNFERYLFDMLERDPEVTKRYMEKLNETGVIDLRNTDYWEAVKNSGFFSGSSTHADRLDTIRKVYKSSGVIPDTHTSDGIKVGLEYKEDGVKMLCLETAKATKFEPVVEEALGFKPERPEKYRGLEDLPRKFIRMENDLFELRNYIEEHARTS